MEHNCLPGIYCTSDILFNLRIENFCEHPTTPLDWVRYGLLATITEQQQQLSATHRLFCYNNLFFCIFLFAACEYRFLSVPVDTSMRVLFVCAIDCCCYFFLVVLLWRFGVRDSKCTYINMINNYAVAHMFTMIEWSLMWALRRSKPFISLFSYSDGVLLLPLVLYLVCTVRLLSVNVVCVHTLCAFQREKFFYKLNSI